MNNLLIYCLSFIKNIKDSYSNLNENDHQNNNRKLDYKCLEVEIKNFLNNQNKDNAFNIYFIFSELFEIFGKGYEKNTQTLLKILCDSEENAGRLSDKHRDHYVHSVNVLLIGISLFIQNKKFRNIYKNQYKGLYPSLEEEFLYSYGITALFHDIGYPFELAFTQIRSTVNELKDEDEEYPYVSYENLDKFIMLNDYEVKKINYLTNDNVSNNILSILAKPLSKYLDLPLDVVINLLNELPKGSLHMDHAYFSALLFLKKAIKKINNKEQYEIILDSVVAIILHNGLCRRLLKKEFKNKKFKPHGSPIAYLLLLCDFLQDYGRECYGKYNHKSIYAYDCEFDIDDDNLIVNYIYDVFAINKLESLKNDFINNIQYLDFIDLFDKVDINVQVKENVKKYKLLSVDDFFANLLNVAIKIHGNYCENSNVISSWDDLNLEYKLSNINQAKSYMSILHELNLFVSKENLFYEEVDNFEGFNIAHVAKKEHQRWMQEKLDLGWKYSNVRNDSLGQHNCLVEYEKLPLHELRKDYDVFYGMIKNFKELGYKIYKLK